jgi:hypothetical protein
MTMLSNLLSGLIGAVIGGLFSFAATLVGIRHERTRMRQDTSHIAAVAVKKNISAIKEAMDDAQWALNPASEEPASAADSALATIRTATRSVMYEYKSLIADKELRSRVDNLATMVITWYENAEKSTPAVNQQGNESIAAYMRCVITSIDAHLDGAPLPPDESARAASHGSCSAGSSGM